MRVVVLLFLLGSACSIARAGNVSIASEPAWLYPVQAANHTPPATRTVGNGYYLELADNQVNISLQTEYRHVIRHIVNESGVQNASEASVTFAPDFQKVLFHKLVLWHNGKAINQLNLAQVKVVQEETEAEEFQYNGLKRAFLIVKGVQKGDLIEFSYSVTGFNPVFSNHFSDKVYFANGILVANYFQTYITPANRPLHIRYFNQAPAPQETEKDNSHIYHWSNPPVQQEESQPGVPGWFDNYPYVAISEFDSWQSVVNWGLQLFNHYQYPLTPALAAKVKQWQEAARGDKDLYTNLAIRYVQDQVRYLGLEIGTYTHQPHTPSLVFEQGFGDCKDKALLLAVLLQQNQIPAWVALVNTVTRSKLAEAAPSSGEFDHAIVAIERSKGYIYADATAAFQRGEPVNIFIPDYGYALLLREGQQQLQPVEPGFLYHTSIQEHLELTAHDSSRLRVNTVYSGGAADGARSSLAETSTRELEESYQQFYSKTYDGIRTAAPVAIEDDSTKNQLTVAENYTMPSLWHTSEKGKKQVDIFSKSVYDLVPDPSDAYKNAPLALPYPRTLKYVLDITMPEDWPFSSEPLHIKNDSYQFDFAPEVKDNVVSLHYYYKTFRDHIPADESNKYREEYKKIASKFGFSLFYTGVEEPEPPAGSQPLPVASNPLQVNWLMVLLAVVFSGVLALLMRWLNKKSAPVYYVLAQGWPLGGWVAVLGITLAIGCLLQIINFTESNYFSGTEWMALAKTGGTRQQFIFFAEMVFNLFCIGGIIALLYWFMNRRDIFPRMFVGYIGSLLTGQLLLLALYNAFPAPGNYGDLQTPLLMQIVRTGIYGLIWVSFVLRSQRVKNTFLQPFQVASR